MDKRNVARKSKVDQIFIDLISTGSYSNYIRDKVLIKWYAFYTKGNSSNFSILYQQCWSKYFGI